MPQRPLITIKADRLAKVLHSIPKDDPKFFSGGHLDPGIMNLRALARSVARSDPDATMTVEADERMHDLFRL